MHDNYLLLLGRKSSDLFVILVYFFEIQNTIYKKNAFGRIVSWIILF